MTFEHSLTHPLQSLGQLAALAQHHFKEWVRREIIDDDPFEVEIWSDGEFVVAECENISYYESVAELEPDKYLEYIQTELELYLK
ncbi:hypothetical protein C1752_01852 [Acaryochloris thomasi RCC1774]|uniref:Uncharacterized protein n=1 Tax=Acaryochloris thomasi RCC1774 TaxID=1764569 RepID=A0A2W1JKV3_9CYAN|nr:hypothetical protein [Acaryochloris thomasi]PZD74033.1 hypothetical protein C1752_01852 [Acaryochloris thomasi RCC1774]